MCFFLSFCSSFIFHLFSLQFCFKFYRFQCKSFVFFNNFHHISFSHFLAYFYSFRCLFLFSFEQFFCRSSHFHSYILFFLFIHFFPLCLSTFSNCINEMKNYQPDQEGIFHYNFQYLVRFQEVGRSENFRLSTYLHSFFSRPRFLTI